MDIYQILTLIISCLSIIVSLVAVVIAYIPYTKKIVFRVSLNPFTQSDDGIEIRFLIINQTNKDLIIESLNAIKVLSFQIFDTDDYPHLVKANDNERFSISSSKLQFNSMQLIKKDIIEKKEKNSKYIKFYFFNSIRETITYKMRIKDYINACKIYELIKKSKEGESDLESIIRFRDEMSYFVKKNKSRY